MSKDKLEISPVEFCCYKIGVRMGQIHQFHRFQWISETSQYADLRILIASLWESIMWLSTLSNLAATPLSRIITPRPAHIKLAGMKGLP